MLRIEPWWVLFSTLIRKRDLLRVSIIQRRSLYFRKKRRTILVLAESSLHFMFTFEFSDFLNSLDTV